MIFRDIIGLLVFIYKIVLIIILLTSFMLSINFGTLTDGIYTIITPFGKKIPNLDKIAYNITRYIYLYKFLMNSSSKIKKSQMVRKQRQVSVKYYLLPKLFYTINEI